MPEKAIETRNKNTKRGLKVAAIAGGLVLVGGVAFAYWTQGGTGNGTATTGTTSAISVNPASVSGLAPGAGAKTLSGTFTNNNSGPVYVTSVTVSITSVVKASGAPAGTCDDTDYTLSNPIMTVGHEVTTGTAVDSWGGATIEFNNKNSNQDACKGATVNLKYDAS